VRKILSLCINLTQERYMLKKIAIIVFLLLCFNNAVAAEENVIPTYGEIAFFSSNQGGISIGVGYVYKIKALRERLIKVTDHELKANLPGWNGEDYEITEYEWSVGYIRPYFFEQVRRFYSNEHDSLYFKDDTAFTRAFESYDTSNTWNVKIDDSEIRDLIPMDKLVKYFIKADLDGDEYDEFLVLYADQPTKDAEGRDNLTPINLLIFEKLSKSLKLSYYDRLCEECAFGTVDIRDVNWNEKPDIIIRFMSSPFYYGFERDEFKLNALIYEVR